MKVVAIVPVKELRRSKERLSSLLSQEEREKLVLWMLDRLLRTLKRTKIPEVLVLSPEKKVLDLARSYGARGVETYSDLNGAVLEGLDMAERLKADAALVLPADIPFIIPADIEKMLNLELERPFVVLIPSKDGGTNALYLSLPSNFRPMFGEDSFQRHLREAKKFNYLVVRNERFELDIDQPEDLCKLTSYLRWIRCNKSG